MFEYMTIFQIIAFFFAIICTITSVITTVIGVKKAGQGETQLKVMSIILVAPFLAITSWLALALSFIPSFANQTLLSLCVAIAMSLIVIGVVVIVAKALNHKYPEGYKEQAKIKQNEKREERNEQIKTLLLTHRQAEAKAKAEEKAHAQAQPQEIKQIEDRKEIKIVPMIDEEEFLSKQTFEESEEIEEDVAPIEETSAVEELEETTSVEEIEESQEAPIVEEKPVARKRGRPRKIKVEEEKEEKTEALFGVPVDEHEFDDIIPSGEETEDISDKEEDITDDDAEFEKFLEALRKKNDNK